MHKSGASWSSGWGRRRIIVLLAIQLFAVGLVISLLQQWPADLGGWFPQSSLDSADAANELAGWGIRQDSRRAGNGKLTRKDETLETISDGERKDVEELDNVFKLIPYYNDLSRSLEKRNHEPPRNQDIFPFLEEDHITIVLYVHNRPQYLKLVVQSLSKVQGIEETLLVVSHDGYFPEMNSIIEEIEFCQVKQIFATFSPHLFPNSFPGQAPDDCKEKEVAAEVGCKGNPDQYGNHRHPRIVSLKHHWWWMMNTIWDGLEETRSTTGHILFIEEDHFLLPNAYRTIQQLSKIVGSKCPQCVAVNLAPWDVASMGEGIQSFIVEKVGNVGYAFNRTVWSWIHARSVPFCEFDEYNWDITMWAAVYPFFPTAGYTLRGPRTSAIHFGKCGLHQGQDKSKSVCIDDDDKQLLTASNQDAVPHLNENWRISQYPIRGYTAGFEGWGGWGDKRDQKLCVDLSRMYHASSDPQLTV